MTAEQHVRVTLEGTATCEPGGQILRLRMGGAAAGPLVLVSKAWPGVTVEDVANPRVWTDHDVVQHVESGRVFSRGGDQWSDADDRAVTTGAADGTYRVLRYQAGDL